MVGKITNNMLRIISLYRSNYLVKSHLREIAKLLKKNHATLLPHIAFLEKEKIVVSDKDGRNKNFSLNLSNPITKEYLLLAEKAETISYLESVFLIRKIMNNLEVIPLSATLILFGSYAKKTYDEESDIDVLYLGEKNEIIYKKIRDIGKQYRKTINIKTVSYNAFEEAVRKKDPLIIEVIKSHILLLNGEYFINALWRYFNEIKQ